MYPDVLIYAARKTLNDEELRGGFERMLFAWTGRLTAHFCVFSIATVGGCITYRWRGIKNNLNTTLIYIFDLLDPPPC